MPSIEETAAAVAALLKQRGDSVAVAESSAGGLISAALLAVPGASAYFKGGGTVYTSASKALFLDLDPQRMSQIRAATPQHALDLARAARTRLDATWGIGETGAAGPTGNRYGDPAGHSCIGIDGPSQHSATCNTGDTDRSDNMRAFASEALVLLEQALRQ
jgi:nicotinamide-nucleotide amidase